MKIWITTASEVEMDVVKPIMAEFLPNHTYFSVGGLGLVATAMHAYKTLIAEKPDLAIQIGIAGTFEKTNSIGSAYLVQSDCIGDQGVWEENQFKDGFALNLIQANDFQYKNKWLYNETASRAKSNGLHLARSVSVNQISTDPNMISYYRNELHADLESMEGAAFHWACIEQKIPFIQIRGVSNAVGDRDKKNWKIIEALEAASSTAIQFIHTYSALK